jgi:hypothetical protein
MQRQAALGHGQCVQRHATRQQQVVDPVVPAETFAPEKNRVDGAQAVKRHGQQEKMSVGEPSHGDSLI